MSTTDTQKKPAAKASLEPFTVEANHPQNCDLMLQSVPGCRLRSRTKPTFPLADGTPRTPQVRGLSIPEIPGMLLMVNPKNRSYKIYDPLNDDDEARASVKSFLRRTGAMSNNIEISGEKDKTGTLDVHRFKTFCREICNLVELGHVRIVDGPSFDIVDVDSLDGKYLLNPGSRIQNTQPTFEEDYETWVDKLTKSGG